MHHALKLSAVPLILLGAGFLTVALGFAYEDRYMLQQCKQNSTEPASCELRIYGR